MNEVVATPITATLVPESRRMGFLARMFGLKGMALVRAEATLYGVAGRLCSAYHGGCWAFFTLSNGGMFAAPRTSAPKLQVACNSNGFEGELSPEAFGLTVTLFTLSELCFDHEDVDRLAENYYQLRDFAAEHAEATAIFEAID